MYIKIQQKVLINQKLKILVMYINQGYILGIYMYNIHVHGLSLVSKCRQYVLPYVFDDIIDFTCGCLYFLKQYKKILKK